MYIFFTEEVLLWLKFAGICKYGKKDSRYIAIRLLYMSFDMFTANLQLI